MNAAAIEIARILLEWQIEKIRAEAEKLKQQERQQDHEHDSSEIPG